MTVEEILKQKNGNDFLATKQSELLNSGSGYTILLRVYDDYDVEKEYSKDHDFSFKKFVRMFGRGVSADLFNLIQSLSDCDELKNAICHPFDFDGHSIQLGKNGMVTFLPYNKTKGRQEISIYKFLKKSFSHILNDEKIKTIGDEITTILSGYETEFVEGSEIADVYRSVDTEDERWVKGSCMRLKPSSYFKVYSDNPDVCKMGVIKKDGEIHGRFLYWKNNEADDEGNQWFADVLYYKSDTARCFFFQYMVENNLKTLDNFDANFQVTLCKRVDSYQELPYFDTLRWSEGDEIITADGRGTEMTSTNGEDFESLSGVWDEHDQCYIDEEDSVYVEYGNFNGITHVDNTVEINFGVGMGYRALSNDCYYSDANEGYCLQ